MGAAPIAYSVETTPKATLFNALNF
eukprot:SAG31_NODE_34877_length_328_cov_0.895197_1_plen_24_part_01